MTMTKTAPYGTWSSPITVGAITEGTISIADVLVDPVTGAVYHIEARPSEAGRNVLVNTSTNIDVVQKDWYVRSRVHEYGGAAAAIRDGVIYFSNFKDGQVYRVKEGEDPEVVTPDIPAYRYADFSIHPQYPHLLFAILEDHTIDVPSKVRNSLCLIDAASKTVQVVIEGHDFFSSPRISPDGTHLAWEVWDHSDMPWEGAQVCITTLSLNVLSSSQPTVTLGEKVSTFGKKGSVSACYPTWATSTLLVLTADESGYQNPWIYDVASDKFAPALAKPQDEDFGAPQWVLGWSPVAIFEPVNGTPTSVFMACREGRSVLYVVDLDGSSTPLEIECPYVDVSSLRSLPDGGFVFVGKLSDQASGVVHCTLTSSVTPTPTYTTLKSTASASSLSSKTGFPDGIISRPVPKTISVPPHNEPVHSVYYPPTNPEYSGSSIEGEKPPCVVNLHGGPTGMESQGLNWTKQFFTSRGFGWVDINYGGSSGYGRKYIARLASKWGLVDVADTIRTAQNLSSAPNNLIDPARIVIRGGSAGGYTTLAAISLPTSVPSQTFAAGTSLYGIADLSELAKDSHTHKFEAQYMRKLIGGTLQEIPDVYKERSPITHVGRIDVPLLVLQGELDEIVPQEQAEMIVKSIHDRGGIVEYKLYEGEGHGFRRAESIKDALERELAFYVRVLKLGA